MYMIKAIIFDFGNVICSFDNQLFLNKLSQYTSKSVDELYNLIYVQSDLPQQYESGKLASAEFFKSISQLSGASLDQELFMEIYTDKFKPINSTFELIKKLKKHYKLALLSNTSEGDFVRRIQTMEIFPLFDVVSTSFEVGAMKPNEKIYFDCIKKLDLEPEECIYIDDIKEYALKANELGMKGIHYTSPDQLIQQLVALQIRV